MSKLASSFVAAGLLLAAGTAQATLIDLKAAAEPGGYYGESAWSTFSLLPQFGFDVEIVGRKLEKDVFAYLDSDKAGMGVCGSLNAKGVSLLGSTTNKSDNLCNPSDDDNVTTDESLRFKFNESVTISKIWFNNNHDGDQSLLGDIISIFGEEFMFVATDPGRGGDAMYAPISPISFAAGDSGDISYFTNAAARSTMHGDEFYLSAIDINRVPEPGTLVLLGVAVAGFGFNHRRRARRAR